MSFIPKLLLKPLAKALAAVFYAMVAHSADTQREAEWLFDHWDISDVPLGYKAKVKVNLIFDESEPKQTPKRRITDIGAERFSYE